MTAPSRRKRRIARAASEPRESTRGRTAFVAVLVVLLGAALAAQLLLPGPSSQEAKASPIAAVPPADALDVEWFCAEGTSSPNGRADETVIIGNVGTTDAEARVEVHSAGVQKDRVVSVPAGTQVRIRVAEIAAVPEPGVTVHARGGRVVVEHLVSGNGDVALGPCARRSSPEWYFAAGSTVKGAFEWLALYNPYPEGALVDVDVFTRDVNGDVTTARPVERITSVNVPGRTRVTVGVHERIGRYSATALAVRARYGRIVAERSLLFDKVDGRSGIAVSLGSPALATAFTFPEGRVGEGRDEIIAIANPTNAVVQATVTSLFEGGITLEPATVSIDPKSVTQYVVPGAPQNLPRVTRVTSSAPVVAEMRIGSGRPRAGVGIATAMGEVGNARYWAFASARLAATTADQYRVFNPNQKPVVVRVRLVGAKDEAGPEVEIAPNTAASIDLKGTAATPGRLLVVSAGLPVVVVRVSEGGGITVSPGMPAA